MNLRILKPLQKRMAVPNSQILLLSSLFCQVIACGALLGRLATVNALLKISKEDSSTGFCRTPFQNIKSKMYPEKPLLLSSIFLRVLIHVPVDAAEGDGN